MNMRGLPLRSQSQQDLRLQPRIKMVTTKNRRQPTRKVQNSPFECPAIDTPNPTSQRTVDQCHPAENEYHGWQYSTALSNTTHQNSRCHATEFHLKETIKDGRYQGRTWRRLSENFHQSEVSEIPDVTIGG